MTMSSVFVPDSHALTAALDAADGPLLVLDPCGELWTQFWQASRWRCWQAWRLMPGQTPEGDNWDVLRELQGVKAREGVAALSGALFPGEGPASLTHRLMVCILTFAEDTRCCADLPTLAGRLWADDLWAVIARWRRQYRVHPALQAAQTLLTQWGAGEAAQAIRERMAVYHHPHVAETFLAGYGFRLETLRARPGQILFLTPGIRCLEDPALMAVYAFITGALRALSVLHYQPFTLFQPTLTHQGAGHEDRKQGA
ncbi:prepilin peptidase-dependent protein [Serratia symbiotica]|uniref:prepilin peptidase-dependent protein n=1 Tax=Serratia symbiotica TaxID=138074 RepID=UPI001CEFD7FA|nr:prepilin peptidase-dependent protein [Serratia symbiotica]